MNKNQLEVLKIVSEDLKILREDVNSNCLPRIVRLSSVILRKLLINNDYLKAWHIAGLPGHPNISVPVIDDFIQDDQIWFAMAGGAEIGGTMIQRIRARFDGEGIVRLSFESYTNDPRGDRCYHFGEPIPLKDFIESTSTILKGTSIRRSSIVKYMANKEGGAHLDQCDRNDTEFKALRDGKDLPVIRHRDFKDANGYNALYFETLSISQRLAWSEDTTRLLTQSDHLLCNNRL